MTDTQLEYVIRELEDEIRHMREAMHDLGPSTAREDAIAARRMRLEAATREFAHRRVEPRE